LGVFLSNYPLCRLSNFAFLGFLYLIRVSFFCPIRRSQSAEKLIRLMTMSENELSSEKVSGIEKCLKRSLSLWANRFTFNDLIRSLLTLGTYESMELEFMQFYTHSIVTVKRFFI